MGQGGVGLGLQALQVVGHEVQLADDDARKRAAQRGQPFVSFDRLNPNGFDQTMAACTFFTISPKLAGSS